MNTQSEQPLWNPYVSGVLLGLVLLATFLVMGRGLGASGGVSTVAAVAVHAVAPAHTAGNAAYEAYLGDGTTSPLKEWLIWELIGVFAGGLLSALLAHRAKFAIDMGPRATTGMRLGLALLGGGFMGFGARLARGCTSGQALSGGALLNAGSWVAMLSIFAGAYALAYFLRKEWL
jgi:uncharacterized membrane protein YedE/YeeE